MTAKDFQQPALQKLDMEYVVGWILSAGVWLSVGFLVVGITWHWMSARSLRFDYVVAGSNLSQFLLDAVRQMIAGRFRPELMVNMGIGFLLITPFLRVAVSALYFVMVRNWKYVVFTGFVLSVLSYSLF